MSTDYRIKIDFNGTGYERAYERELSAIIPTDFLSSTEAIGTGSGDVYGRLETVAVKYAKLGVRTDIYLDGDWAETVHPIDPERKRRGQVDGKDVEVDEVSALPRWLDQLRHACPTAAIVVSDYFADPDATVASFARALVQNVESNYVVTVREGCVHLYGDTVTNRHCYFTKNLLAAHLALALLTPATTTGT